MSRQYFCSNCGIEVELIRKAVPGKGRIIDLIVPHECEGFAIMEVDEGEDKETVLQILESLEPVGPLHQVGSEEDIESQRESLRPPGDRRSEKNKIPIENIRSALNLEEE